MSRRILAPLIVVGLTAGFGALPAHAKHKKPITKSWSVALAPMPIPPTGPACSESVENVQEDREPFKAPEAGTLEVILSGYTGDWDLVLLNSKGAQIATSNGFVDATTEKIKYKIKAAGDYVIEVCNFAGAPPANVKYTFTYLK